MGLRSIQPMEIIEVIINDTLNDGPASAMPRNHQPTKKKAEEPKLSKEELASRRKLSLQVNKMLSDEQAEHIRHNREATDLEIDRVIYKYVNDTRSILMNHAYQKRLRQRH